MSFAAKLPVRPEGDSEPAFRVPDFVVGTNRAYAVACEASAFEELDPERRYRFENGEGHKSGLTWAIDEKCRERRIVIFSPSGRHIGALN